MSSKRGFPALMFCGYMFNKHRNVGQKVRWKCSKQTMFGCRAMLYTEMNNNQELTLTKHNNDHNH